MANRQQTQPKGRVFVPVSTFSTTYNGADVMMIAGLTTVREGHELYKRNPDAFRPVESRVDYEV